MLLTYFEILQACALFKLLGGLDYEHADGLSNNISFGFLLDSGNG